jgi:predicted membrane chloride channel (bestrophin family)
MEFVRNLNYNTERIEYVSVKSILRKNDPRILHLVCMFVPYKYVKNYKYVCGVEITSLSRSLVSYTIIEMMHVAQLSNCTLGKGVGHMVTHASCRLL